ncbi:restriction endonuclease subunit S [Leptolyngbya sp. NIES-2104]|uniref:restriction endonuclease subunit S n=1 Tax=Leptolyngbya sp. NIES-2104 TaxID=1552121 RepID=UPI0006EC965D|nr:restriction endonuclease subunit S [Leptolyngbya sp. NIES-2104]GAQ00150.1 type I restriction-modification system, specificity subunit S [Leptolyngbya sp. NIES-2104]
MNVRELIEFVNSGNVVGTFPRGFSQNTVFKYPLVRADSLVTLNYGKGLVEKNRISGDIPVYGTNGRCGWHNEGLVKGPGVILGRKGMGPLGVEWCESDFWVIDTAYYVTPNTPSLDLKFFYYLTKYIGLNHLKDGTSNPSLSRDTFSAQLLPFPPINKQKAIAQILSSLDDKIELNQQMNQTLEAITRALFKSWFVDFDPVRAKMDDQQLIGIDAETAALFPAEFESSVLGEIPKGWRVGVVEDEFQITMGQSPSSSTYNQDKKGLPFYQGRKDFGSRYPSVRVYCNAPTRFANAGDTLISVRAPVGDINLASEQCCIGRGVAAARHKDGSRSYTYYTMQGLNEHFARFEAKGTIFGSMSKKDFLSIPCIVPSVATIRRFEQLAFPLDQCVENQAQQILTLLSIRDTLLPALLAGKTLVKDIQSFVESQL